MQLMLKDTQLMLKDTPRWRPENFQGVSEDRCKIFCTMLLKIRRGNKDIYIKYG
jgi:hypothetical protein